MKETTKLGIIISNSKDTIFSLETKIKTLEMEIECLKEREQNLNQNTSTSNEEPDMCNSCDNLKDEVSIFINQLSNSPKGEITYKSC